MCSSSTASDAARAFALLCFGTATCNKSALAVLQILFPLNLTYPAVVNRVEKMWSVEVCRIDCLLLVSAYLGRPDTFSLYFAF